ncbi:MAG TPA: hypothetical protein VMV92_22170 [Streptosporangiaceae bacterium]|nr:hypothetical protein [Streptosporangiaceae bacterium]
MADVPLEQRRAVQVAHSLNVIAELPRYVDDAAVPVALRVAAVDAFFIHLRLLIEFLIKRSNPGHPAIHRDDYASGFHLGSVDPALYRRLRTDFDFASQQVAHFSLNRVPTEESAGVDYVDAARLRSRAEDVFGAMGAFIRHMRATQSAYADDFERWLSDAKTRRAEAPPTAAPASIGNVLRALARRLRSGLFIFLHLM